MFYTNRDIMGETVIGLMHNLIDRNWTNNRLWMRSLIRGQFLFELSEPSVEQFCRTGIECWERTDNTCFTLCSNKLWTTGNK